MKPRLIYAAFAALTLTACGSAESQNNAASSAENQQTDSIESTTPQAPASEILVTEEMANESAARQFYIFTVLAQDPDYDFMRAVCTPEFVGKLAAAYDYDGEGYAVWLLRSGEQDGDGPTEILNVSSAGENAMRVDYLDMGHEGSTILHFTNGKISGASRPDGSSVFS